jgi:hypothetical protein
MRSAAQRRAATFQTTAICAAGFSATGRQQYRSEFFPDISNLFAHISGDISSTGDPSRFTSENRYTLTAQIRMKQPIMALA